MYSDQIKLLLEQVRGNSISIEDAMTALKHLPYESLGFATIDHHRSLRQGVPEVIFCQNKTLEEITEIIHCLQNKNQPVLATRATQETFEALKDIFPDGEFYERSRVITIGGDHAPTPVGNVLIACAGTSDLPVAEEAAVTAQFTGSNVTRLTDVGVAGIHRLLGRLDIIHQANAIVVVAGMEGALASVIGGLAEAPVIATPTSVGYGASFGGIAALLSMLNSCSAGVTVVNIDNGFGAGFAASLINKRICQAKTE